MSIITEHDTPIKKSIRPSFGYDTLLQERERENKREEEKGEAKEKEEAKENRVLLERLKIIKN